MKSVFAPEGWKRVVSLPAWERGLKFGQGSHLLFKRIKKRRLYPYLDELNRRVQRLVGRYLEYAEDVLRVKYVFADFLDNFFHTGDSMPTPHQAAEAYNKILLAKEEQKRKDTSGKAYLYFKKSARQQIDRSVLEIKNEDGLPELVICDVIRYADLGSLLADELFAGIASGQIPRRCGCCGTWFLLTNGYYAGFCDGLAPDGKGKSCREIGSHQKYIQKVKSNPIWLAYSRAYKTHYARYMKKKMTTAEFERWSREAMRQRDAMLTGESPLSMQEYEAWMKV